MNTHPFIRSKKERIGWGRWGTVIIRKCTVTGQEIRVRKNWHGSKPAGAMECPHCRNYIDL